MGVKITTPSALPNHQVNNGSNQLSCPRIPKCCSIRITNKAGKKVETKAANVTNLKTTALVINDEGQALNLTNK